MFLWKRAWIFIIQQNHGQNIFCVCIMNIKKTTYLLASKETVPRYNTRNKTMQSPLWMTVFKTLEEKMKLLIYLCLNTLWKVVFQSKVRLLNKQKRFGCMWPLQMRSIPLCKIHTTLFWVLHYKLKTPISLFWQKSSSMCYCYVTNMYHEICNSTTDVLWNFNVSVLPNKSEFLKVFWVFLKEGKMSHKVWNSHWQYVYPLHCLCVLYL